MTTARTGATAATFDSAASLWGGVWMKLGSRLGLRDRRLEAEDGTRVLRLFGVLDKRLAKEIKLQAQGFAQAEGNTWSIDLSGITAWDGDGLAALVYALDLSELSGKTVTLLDPCPRLRHTLQRSQLHHLFHIIHRHELGA
jgi:anti-anti-sigma regulatory factor